MERKIFRGIGAVIVAVESDVRFTVVPKMLYSESTDFSPERHIAIDLSRTPSRAARWTDVEIDDRGIDANGNFLGSAMSPAQLSGYHVTTLGGYMGAGLPDDLLRGPFVGAVFLEDSVFIRNRGKIGQAQAWPTSGLRSYQLTTIAYSDAPTNELYRKCRYAGFHGRLVKWVTPRIASVMLYDLAGSPLGRTWDFDLGAPEQCDPDPPVAAGESALSTASKPDHQGAIFVNLRHLPRIDGDGNTGPKIPIGLGA